MDSLHFTWLCFLLLTVAAPRSTIAMPSNNPAEGSQDSSFGKTNVTVYHCENCKRNICELSSYEDFVKIAETQSETFSNEKIQLVTKETHIKMCFQQDPEGFYAIVWEKPTGVGEACNYLNSGASSENVSGNIIQICCEAKTDILVSSSHLNCHPEPSTAYITGDPGNPQFLISKKTRNGVIIPVLILGVCAAAALVIYCVRQKRNYRGTV